MNFLLLCFANPVLTTVAAVGGVVALSHLASDPPSRDIDVAEARLAEYMASKRNDPPTA